MCFLCCRLSGSFGFTRPFGKKAILCQEPTNQQCSTISYVIFFFLHGSTTLYRVLPFSTNFSFHPLLSCVRVFQFGTLLQSGRDVPSQCHFIPFSSLWSSSVSPSDFSWLRLFSKLFFPGLGGWPRAQPPTWRPRDSSVRVTIP